MTTNEFKIKLSKQLARIYWIPLIANIIGYIAILILILKFYDWKLLLIFILYNLLTNNVIKIKELEENILRLNKKNFILENEDLKND